MAPPRHQTLRATIDWSYRLLDVEERHVLACLAVFVGDFSLEAAEGVCSDACVPQPRVLDLLAHLVDRSLVVCETLPDQPSRYHLLETVRQYARERLIEQGIEARPVTELDARGVHVTDTPEGPSWQLR